MSSRGALSLLLCAVSVGCGLAGGVGVAAADEQRYVVVLDDSAGRPGVVAGRHAQRQGARIERVLSRSVRGYAARLSAAEAKAIARQPGVAAVGLDPKGEPAGQTFNLGNRRVFSSDGDCNPGDNPAINLNIDVDCTDDQRVDADVAVLDTAISPAEPDLNVVSNVDCFANDPTPTDGNPSDHTGCDTGPGPLGNECNSIHGTAVGTLAGAIDNDIGVAGVAPGVRLWSVAVADNDVASPSICTPNPQPFYMSDVIAGVEWVTAHAAQIEVANMSMRFALPTTQAGQALDAALEQAINDSIDAGVVYVVAGGNEATSIENAIPAKYNRAITATSVFDSDGLPNGAGSSGSGCHTDTSPTDLDDTNADMSNYGPYPGTTNPWAPGADIAAPGPCTSGAAARTTGAVAILASNNNPNNATDVANIRHTLLTNADPDTRANGGYDDNSPHTNPPNIDPNHREPLLDLHDETVFDPSMIITNGTDTVGMYWTGQGMWQLRNSNSAGSPNYSFGYWWSSLDKPITGDWNGDGIDTVGMYWPSTGTWQLRNSNSAGTPHSTFNYHSGSVDVPVAGDWNGDGTDTIGTYTPTTGTWRLRDSNTAGLPDHVFTFQTTTADVPVTGDWDGDGTDTIGTYSPGNGTWRLRNANSAGAPQHTFGYWWSSQDIPVTGDWNGDGTDTVGMYWSTLGMWQLRNSNSAGAPDHSFGYWWSTADAPQTGDWDGL